MSISDRLDELQAEAIEANEQWDCGRSAFNANNHAPPIDVALANSELMLAALRAVLDLHKPEKFMDSEETCSGCDIGTLDPPTWPCQTVRAVEAALGMEYAIEKEEGWFDRWLDEVKAQVWDEGYSSCNEYQNGYVPAPRPNPYRKGN